MRRLPVAAFVALAVATVAAFFVTQHLKVATPLLAGFPAPAPAQINPVDGHTCKGVDHRRMFVSFYLQNRSDDVDVYVVGADGTVIRTLADGVHMAAGSHPVRRKFFWDGHAQDGSVVPDGTYYIKVALIHQGRSVLISNNAGAEPITVETVPPRPRVTAVRPSIVPATGVSAARIQTMGTGAPGGRILVYRTDQTGGPRLVKSFAAQRGRANWDGTISGRPAPQGTYLIGLVVTDPACNTGRFPPELPPAPGTTAGAGLTVRYLAAQPPLTPVPAGSDTTVYVDARQHLYHWALRRAGAEPVLASGRTRSVGLRVALPGGAATLYELAVRYGAHRSVVPVFSSATTRRRPRVLVVLPALTWQGRNPVDDDHDGVPNTLTAGYPVALARPLVDGLPQGFADTVNLLTYLRRHHLAYDLTSDLALAAGRGPALSAYRGAILAGDELWTPAALAGALRSYVDRGGRLLSLGIDSLRRGVTLTATRAFSPTAPRTADVLGARPGAVTPTRGALILVVRDGLHIFAGASGALRAGSFQPFSGVTPPLRIVSAAGVSAAHPTIIGYRLGRGLVVDVGLPGFGSSLARSFDARQLLARIWSLLR